MSELNAVMPLETPNFGPSTGIAAGPSPDESARADRAGAD
jgi:hypothetical protein